MNSGWAERSVERRRRTDTRLTVVEACHAEERGSSRRETVSASPAPGRCVNTTPAGGAEQPPNNRTITSVIRSGHLMGCAGAADMCGVEWSGTWGWGAPQRWVGTAITSEAKVCVGRRARFESQTKWYSQTVSNNGRQVTYDHLYSPKW